MPVGSSFRGGVLGGVGVAIPDSVVHHYPTDAGSGTTLVDDEGATDGTINGATWVTGSGGNGDAYLDYDGADDYVDFNNAADPFLPATADWTINAWVTVDTLSSKLTLLSQYIADGGNGRLVFSESDTDQAFQLFLGNDDTEPTTDIITSTSLSTGAFYMVSARRSGNTFSIHLNGTEEGTVTDSGTRDILQTGNLLGARTSSGPGYNDSLSAFQDGIIDEVWIADSAVSDSTLSNYYENTKDRYP